MELLWLVLALLDELLICQYTDATGAMYDLLFRDPENAWVLDSGVGIVMFRLVVTSVFALLLFATLV